MFSQTGRGRVLAIPLLTSEVRTSTQDLRKASSSKVEARAIESQLQAGFR